MKPDLVKFFIYAVSVVLAFGIGWHASSKYWAVTALDAELKTMTVWSYGPYILLMAKPGARMLKKYQLQEVRDNEDKWRSPLWNK